jgi:DNA helicase-2/ATP-dependent DNA helicase PcrA
VAWLIESGVPPDRILLLTFTRRAAAEMIHRADQLTGRQMTARVWGGTFHAVAHRLLRFHGQALGLPPGFSVIDAGDAARPAQHDRTIWAGQVGSRFPVRRDAGNLLAHGHQHDKLSGILTRHWPWWRGVCRTAA